ncbi:TIGR01777 family oxidoreductase [Salinibacterium sp. SYSU T00001]|uniref:TIGR01777 family oxidoreductase n=1 Tax=Homoserinimonas sedimenticola TaxID=2986805 RepID=UPI00223654DF|nr:TIGR01777 family oxidoreductase [Salinibacterium sedimenticola]MCW4384239.1 TIGR01777 family oxidoreductase [Salinibacterium sedimenticola]
MTPSSHASTPSPTSSSGRTVLIAGASGFIGGELVRQLRDSGHRVVRLVRRPVAHEDERQWDPAAHEIPAAAIEEADAVVNLSGASLSRLPWTYRYKRQILHSRLDATSTLAQAIAAAKSPPTVFVSGSAVGYYGDRPHEVLDEESSRGSGFLPRVVESWEGATRAADATTRVVHARTGLVLGDGGALAPLQLLARLGLAGPLGDGRQVWPWISLHDEAAAIRHLLFDSTLRGPVNLVGPNPASAGEIAQLTAHRLGRPYWLPAPRWAIIAGLADAGRGLLLADQRIRPSRLLDDGFEFREPTAEKAIVSGLT